jgi:hypothetical protein
MPKSVLGDLIGSDHRLKTSEETLVFGAEGAYVAFLPLRLGVVIVGLMAGVLLSPKINHSNVNARIKRDMELSKPDGKYPPTGPTLSLVPPV